MNIAVSEKNQTFLDFRVEISEILSLKDFLSYVPSILEREFQWLLKQIQLKRETQSGGQ